MMNLLSLLSLHHVERLLLQTSSVSSLLTRGNGLTFPHPSRKDISTKKKITRKRERYGIGEIRRGILSQMKSSLKNRLEKSMYDLDG